MGLGGLDIRLVVNRLERIGLQFRPDLIVYGFTVNDIETPQEFGMREQGEPDPLLAEWRRFDDSPIARGFSVSQSFPAFRWRRASDLRIGPLDDHPNDEGHRILAEVLFEGLTQLPPRCGLRLD